MPTTKNPAVASKPEFQRVGDKFYWQADGHEYVIPLVFETGIYRRIAAMQDAVLQFALVLTELDLDKALLALDKLDTIRGGKAASAYFEAFTQHNQAAVGE